MMWLEESRVVCVGQVFMGLTVQGLEHQAKGSRLDSLSSGEPLMVLEKYGAPQSQGVLPGLASWDWGQRPP